MKLDELDWKSSEQFEQEWEVADVGLLRLWRRVAQTTSSEIGIGNYCAFKYGREQDRRLDPMGEGKWVMWNAEPLIAQCVLIKLLSEVNHDETTRHDPDA